MTIPPPETEERRKAFRATLHAMPGWPWLPCPICRGIESCDHTAVERARARGIQFGTETEQ